MRRMLELAVVPRLAVVVEDHFLIELLAVHGDRAQANNLLHLADRGDERVDFRARVL
jgi:hypothetical protein